MKKHHFLIPLLGILCLSIAFALSGCSQDDEEPEYPENCWLTECLILNEAPSYSYKKSDKGHAPGMFGTSGESGLASEWAVERDGKLSETNQYWLVCLIYGAGAPVRHSTKTVEPIRGTVVEPVSVATRLKFSYLQEMQVLYNEECVEFGQPRATDNFTLAEDFAADDLTNGTFDLQYEEREDGSVKGTVVIPFSMKVQDPKGILRVELDLELGEDEAQTYRVDTEAMLHFAANDDNVQAEISEMAVHYLTPNAYNDGNYDETMLGETASFADSKICYMVLDFTVKTLKDNDGTHAFYVVAASPERSKMAIEIEEAPTGKIEETIRDGKTILYGSYTLPATEGGGKKVRMIFSLCSIGGGDDIEVDLFVSGDERVDISGEAWMGQRLNAPLGELQYTLNDDGRSYSVSGFSGQSYSFVEIPKALGDGFPVTGIAAEAFNYLLEGITIPASVICVAERAFAGCSYLKSIVVASENPVYHSAGNCLIETATKTLIAGCENSMIPNDGSVMRIGGSAFYEGSVPRSITIPDGVTDIGDFAFYDCLNLTAIILPNSLTRIGEGAFYNCVNLAEMTIPDGVMTIGNSAFYRCKMLKTMTIPNRVNMLGDSAFENCEGLTSVTLSNGISVIGNSVFAGCKNLSDVTMPTSVTSIGDHAFKGCEKLRSVSIPDTVTAIGESAFYGCVKLTSVAIPSGMTVIGNSVFRNCGIVLITIPNGVTDIGAWAFSGCPLTSVTIPSSVRTIGNCAFENCGDLTSITISKGVATIGTCAFRGCKGLKAIVLPSTVTFSDFWWNWFENSNITAVYYCGYTSKSYDQYQNFDKLPPPIYNYSLTEPTEKGKWWHYDENGNPVIWPPVTK